MRRSGRLPIIVTLVASAACTVDAPLYLPGAGDGDGGVDASVDAPPNGAYVQVSPGDITVGEGAQVVVRVRLSEPPPADATVTVQPIDPARLTASPASLTFTQSNWHVERVVTLLSTADDDAGDDRVTVVFDGAGVVADGSALVTVTDDDLMRLIVAPELTLGVGEAQPAAVQVRLSARPAGPVTVAASATPGGAMGFAPGTLTFTPTNWSNDQALTVTGIDDVDTLDEAVRLTLDPDLDGVASHAVEVTVIDDDILNILATPGSLGALTENGAARALEVRLTQQPAGTVTVALGAAPTGAVTLSRTSLTFDGGNWSTPQPVAVAAPSDPDVDDAAVTITLTSAGLTSRTVMAVVEDDDTQAILASPTALTAMAEGTSRAVGVRLAYQPSGPTVVRVSSLDPARVGVDVDLLTFTTATYATAHAVAVTALHDPDLVGGTTTVRLHVDADGVTRDIPVDFTDDDTQSIVVDTTTLAIAEATTASLAVHLAFEPAAPVTVAVTSSDDRAIGVSPATLTFTPTNYGTAQPVAVTGRDDPDANNEAGTVTLEATGIGPRLVNVTVNDDDVRAVRVAPSSLTLVEGGSAGELSVQLGAQPSAPVTVSVTVHPPGAAAAVPASMTFDPTTWDTPQTVTVRASQDADVANGTATVSLTAPGLAARAATATIHDDDVLTPVLDPAVVTVAEGQTATRTVRLSHDPGGTITVVAAGVGLDLATVSPPQLSFTSTSWTQPQPIAVTARTDDDDLGGITTMRFTAAGGGAADLTITVTDPTLIVGFRPPHPSPPTASPGVLRAFAVPAPAGVPACLVIEKILVAVTEVPAAGPAQVRVGLYAAQGDQPRELVLADPPRTVTVGTHGFAVGAAVRTGWPLWIAIEATPGVSFATGASPVAQCARMHDFSTGLPARFDRGPGQCAPRRPSAVWIVGRDGGDSC